MQIGGALAIAVAAIAAACAHPADPLVDLRYAGAVTRAPDGRIARSAAVVAAFKRQWPCPSTGERSGACPGWYADHVVPLACGGADAVWNLQWLPASLKLAPAGKDGFEREIYGGNGMSKGCP